MRYFISSALLFIHLPIFAGVFEVQSKNLPWRPLCTDGSYPTCSAAKLLISEAWLNQFNAIVIREKTHSVLVQMTEAAAASLRSDRRDLEVKYAY